MIYRLIYGDGMDDENIHLRVKVTSQNTNVHLHRDFDNKHHMRIADIKIEGNRVNRGYGSILMDGVMKLVAQMEIRLVTG
ncbi:hypothetical protein J41TS12_06000 [Paenibacillus antibioticophila]|uniref:Uncharacterized protein n=1 Tax=Paenibacillus antibioticophila TaxID=1274374 RepID=A0A920CG59_9BACL|nr:hypothetical protein [Paenibacillus antibioticophila]GIO35739.1 hypothetical protein J41TS12_06000 [Paenibacillus antibioticophila]